MDRVERDPGPGVTGRAPGVPADEEGFRVLLGRSHHELSTPLLTAAGFGRIALDLLDGPTGSRDPDRDELRAALARVVDGVERARAVLTAATALAEHPRFARVDLVEVLRRAAADLASAGVPVELVGLPATIRCHGVPAVLDELAALLLRLLALDGRGPGGAPTAIAVSASDAASASVVVTFETRGEQWPAEVLAAATGPPTAVPADVRASADLARRVAALGSTQLGRLWLDPDPGPGRRLATLRLLAGDRPRPDEDDS